MLYGPLRVRIVYLLITPVRLFPDCQIVSGLQIFRLLHKFDRQSCVLHNFDGQTCVIHNFDGQTCVLHNFDRHFWRSKLCNTQV